MGKFTISWQTSNDGTGTTLFELYIFGGGLGIKKPRTKVVESVNFNGFREVELKFFGVHPLNIDRFSLEVQVLA